jgi:hypothetical protein
VIVIPKTFNLERNRLMDDILKSVPKHKCGKFFATQSASLETKTKTATSKCEKKFKDLMDHHMQVFTMNTEESNVYNFSETEIPKNVNKNLELRSKILTRQYTKRK